jgi:hypothetical protein
MRKNIEDINQKIAQEMYEKIKKNFYLYIPKFLRKNNIPKIYIDSLMGGVNTQFKDMLK